MSSNAESWQDPAGLDPCDLNSHIGCALCMDVEELNTMINSEINDIEFFLQMGV